MDDERNYKRLQSGLIGFVVGGILIIGGVATWPRYVRTFEYEKIERDIALDNLSPTEREVLKRYNSFPMSEQDRKILTKNNYLKKKVENGERLTEEDCIYAVRVFKINLK